MDRDGATDWIPASIPPYWWGTYELYEEGVGVVGFLVWTFGKWHWPSGEVELVHEWRNPAWRGITKPCIGLRSIRSGARIHLVSPLDLSKEK